MDQKSLNDINQELVTPEEALAARSGNLSNAAALAETAENKKQNKLGKSKKEEKSTTWRLNRRPACDQLGPESRKKMTEIEPFTIATTDSKSYTATANSLTNLESNENHVSMFEMQM